MILMLHGIRKDATASLDLLTRAVVISLYPAPGGADDRPHSHTAGGGTPGLPFRMTVPVPASTC